jgi:hypothetical protein
MLEKDIENLIAKYPDEFFPSSGFKLIGQQIRLGKCFADIIFEDKFNRKVIVEVKRGILSRDASGQVTEYYGLLKNEQPDGFVELVLCANIIPAERKKFLETIGIECKELGINSINIIAEKYNYQFIDAKQKNKTIEPELIALIPEAERVWIFQANPNRYDVLNALSDDAIGPNMHWTVNQHINEIAKGHLALIWLSGAEGGIYALTEITSNPQLLNVTNDEDKYWVDTSYNNKERLRVKLKVLKNMVNKPIYRNELKATIGLENISIFRQSQGTNFPLTNEEWRIIKDKYFKHKT